MNLRTGIVKEQPHWTMMLEQSGVTYSLIDFKSDIEKEYSVLIINSSLKREEQKQVISYVKNGGSLLIEAGFGKDIVDAGVKSKYIKYIHDGEISGRRIPLTDVYSKCRLSSLSNTGLSQDSDNIFHFTGSGKGHIAEIPSGFAASVLNNKSCRKNFYSSYAGGFTSERVSKVSKGEVRYIISLVLEYLYLARNLPFVTLRHYPADAAGIFAFRVDTDFAAIPDAENLFGTIQRNNIKATWFVETKSSEEAVKKFVSFPGQETGLHCYRHKVFKSFRKNLSNLRSGLKILKKAGCEPDGFAAPYGEWNQQLARALEKLGFRYSSEFSYAYDALPFYPAGNNTSAVLQIPVHPVSFGRLFWSGHDDNGMLGYFSEIINKKLARDEPLVLYTHPGEKRFEILGKIFRKINEMNIPSVTFSEYAGWWIQRSTLKWEAFFADGQVKIRTGNKDKNFWYSVKNPGGEIHINPLISDSFSIKKIKLPAYSEEIPDPAALRKYSWRMFKDDLLFKMRKYKQ